MTLLNDPPPYGVMRFRESGVEVAADAAVEAAAAAAEAEANETTAADKTAAQDPDAWLDAALRQPLPPESALKVLGLLAPVLDAPFPTVDQPPLPPISDLVALHRAELEADFTEPPAAGANAEPPIPLRFAAGPSVLPHIEFPA